MQRSVKYCFFSVVVFLSVSGYGQQQPLFTQYMFNGLVLNPAYAGAQETFTATAVLRKQWAGIADAPETQTFAAHSPFDNLRTGKRPGSPVSLGLVVFHDRVAITGQTGLLASYAYRIRISADASLSFGLQGGFNHFRMRYSELELDDPSFSQGDISALTPDFGAGLYYQASRFYAGLSAPQMLRPKTDQTHSSLSLAASYFLTTGFVFDITHAVKIKPNVLIRSFASNLQLDINCNLFLNEILNLGVSWRSFESVGTLMQFQFHPRFAFGYAYDIPFGSEFSRLSNGSHEILVNYRVPRKKIRTINPRFF